MIEVNDNGQVRVKFGYNDVWVNAGVINNLYLMCFEQVKEPVEPGTVLYDQELDFNSQSVIIDFSDADVDTFDSIIDELTFMRNKKRQLQEKV